MNLAVGARVMLRRNIDTKAGLVNGAIGSVIAIAPQHITVKFDHLGETFNVEKVKGKFMVMKNYYVYRRQFPLILAYAVTIHKCQGLSLDCAIIDLSDSIFATGMAYVALSRVRSLSGIHLVSFSPTSIKVSHSSLKEINRLRAAFRKDLDLYPIPEPTTKCSKKRKLESSLHPNFPRAKRGRPRKADTSSGIVPAQTPYQQNLILPERSHAQLASAVLPQRRCGPSNTIPLMSCGSRKHANFLD